MHYNEAANFAWLSRLLVLIKIFEDRLFEVWGLIVMVNYGDFFFQGVNKDSYLILEKLPPE